MPEFPVPETDAIFLTPKLILGLRSASERRYYKETPSPIGWAQT